MTEWNGIKVGGLYKMTSHAYAIVSARAPMAMVVSIERCEDIFSRAVVTLLEEGKLLREGTWGHSNEWDASECQFGNGRYKAVAV
jgi:hypothetical protein